MKIIAAPAMLGEAAVYIYANNGVDYVRYSSNCWKVTVDTPTGDIEEGVYDSDLEAQLEAAYQEYIK